MYYFNIFEEDGCRTLGGPYKSTTEQSGYGILHSDDRGNKEWIGKISVDLSKEEPEIIYTKTING